MELAICTDVYADLSYREMLDKVKSLGINAVEMTAGGWGARTHVNTEELLTDEGKRRAFLAELETREMRISALNMSGNPLWPSETGKAWKEFFSVVHMMGYKGDVSLEMEDLTMTVDAGVETSIEALKQTISR